MLSHLHIENYALIRHLDIDFESGFSTITGETGAGKSIILGALGLVMGAKADAGVITEGEKLCVIEAEFRDGDTDILVRRELHAEGRSRSFVNDEVVSQAELKTLAAKMIDIHSQHENLLLSDDSFQLSVVDNLARNEQERETYHKAWEQHESLAARLSELQRRAVKDTQEEDYIRYQAEELQKAHLSDGEEQELEQEVYRLSHADEIARELEQSIEQLDGEGGAIRLIRASKIEDQALQERLESVRIELRDIVDETQRLLDRTESNPERLQEAEERLDMINSLLRKHGKQTTAELLALQREMDERLNSMARYDEEINALKAETEAAGKTMTEAAAKLSDSRRAIIPSICRTLEQSLKELGIVHAKMDIELKNLDSYVESGHDEVDMLFAANLGQSPKSIAKVASGGEISRVMLAIKSLIADTAGLPTILFDEIDTGVSGEIACRMGDILHDMGRSRQVIAITHLPQIAIRGDQQYRVYKADTEDHTETHIGRMTDEDRKQYIEEYHVTLSGKTAS